MCLWLSYKKKKYQKRYFCFAFLKNKLLRLKYLKTTNTHCHGINTSIVPVQDLLVFQKSCASFVVLGVGRHPSPPAPCVLPCRPLPPLVSTKNTRTKQANGLLGWTAVRKV
jgi:hypothetical protein